MGSFIVHFLRQLALSLFYHKHLLPRVRGKYGREEKKTEITSGYPKLRLLNLENLELLSKEEALKVSD